MCVSTRPSVASVGSRVGIRSVSNLAASSQLSRSPPNRLAVNNRSPTALSNPKGNKPRFLPVRVNYASIFCLLSWTSVYIHCYKRDMTSVVICAYEVLSAFLPQSFCQNEHNGDISRTTSSFISHIRTSFKMSAIYRINHIKVHKPYQTIMCDCWT
jgi:hypothetical protein